MKPSAIFAKALLLGGLAFGLAACDGKEDFSDIGRGNCPMGDPSCGIGAHGDLFVELSGPVVAGLGYRCTGSANSKEYIKLVDETYEGDKIVPAGMAVCPNNAEDIVFYLGDAAYEGNYIEIGKAYLPVIGRVKLHTGSEQEIVRLTWADVIESPRRLDVLNNTDDKAKLDQRFKVLSLFVKEQQESFFTQAPVEFPICVNDALHSYLEGNEELKKKLESYDFDAWQDFVTALESGLPPTVGLGDSDEEENAEQPEETVDCEFESPTEFVDLDKKLRFAMSATRSGAVKLSYQDESLLAHLINKNIHESPDPLNIGQLEGELLVFPDGSLKGFPSVTKFSREAENAKIGEIKRDVLAVSSGSITDDLTLEEVRLKGLKIQSPAFLRKEEDSAGWNYPGGEFTTDLKLSGRFISSMVLDGIVWDPGEGSTNKSDAELVFPLLSKEELDLKQEEKGRFEGKILDDDVSSIMIGKVEQAPLRLAKTFSSSAQLHEAVIKPLVAAQLFTLTIMRPCEEGESGCAEIDPTYDAGNYPTIFYPESDMEIDQGGNINSSDKGRVELLFTHHKPLVNELTLELAEDQNDGHIYMEHDGQRVGYISHTEMYKESDSLAAESAIFTIIFDDETYKTVDDSHDLYGLYGVQLQGRFDLRCGETKNPEGNRFYRLGDDNFKQEIAANWIGNYWTLKKLEEIDNATKIEPALIYSQGSAYLAPSVDICP